MMENKRGCAFNIVIGERVTHQVNVAGRRTPLTLTAELLYQAVSYSFAEDLRPDGLDLGDRFLSMYDLQEKLPVVIARVQTSVS